MKFDLIVHIDFQRIYDDSTFRFQSKSNLTVRIKSQQVFNNPMAISTLKFFINTPKIIQFYCKLINSHLSFINLTLKLFFLCDFSIFFMTFMHNMFEVTMNIIGTSCVGMNILFIKMRFFHQIM